MLGKTFKGLTDAMLMEQTEWLQRLETARDRHTVYVRPEVGVEVAFNDLQASPQYPAGLALRFARVKRYRPRQARGTGGHYRDRARDLCRKRSLVWCLTNTVTKMRGHFCCRQGAMTCRGGFQTRPCGRYHARKSNAADGQKDPQIRKRICETPH